MAYSDFTLHSALDAFELTIERDVDLFPDVPPLEPGPSLRHWLDRFAPIALGVNSEYARSVYIIAPILGEASERAAGPMTVMPGVTFDVDRGRGLNGFCDYLITRTAEYFFVRGPVLAVIEAKREDLIAGLGQCAASMVAIRQFNATTGTPLPAVYGAVTSGTNWRFLRLTGSTLSVGREYYVQDVGAILGVLVHVAAAA